jgi:uncharacterized DUF497 family protein
MRFSWDPDKSDANLRDRGFDFAFATLIFDGPTLEREDSRKEYGERRIIATGLAQGLELTVCYTDRASPGQPLERRIISARRSHRRERQAYQQAIKGR